MYLRCTTRVSLPMFLRCVLPGYVSLCVRVYYPGMPPYVCNGVLPGYASLCVYHEAHSAPCSPVYHEAHSAPCSPMVCTTLRRVLPPAHGVHNVAKSPPAINTRFTVG